MGNFWLKQFQRSIRQPLPLAPLARPAHHAPSCRCLEMRQRGFLLALLIELVHVAHGLSGDLRDLRQCRSTQSSQPIWCYDCATCGTFACGWRLHDFRFTFSLQGLKHQVHDFRLMVAQRTL